MILGIDAFNLRRGGGVTHLVELLRSVKPHDYGFERIVVWGSNEILLKIDERDWLDKSPQPLLEKGLLFRVFWQRFLARKLARQKGCDIVFVPGGANASGFKPVVTMCRNMLPFEWKEMRRYGYSLITFKLLLLRFAQIQAFIKADGLIFLTNYAEKKVMRVLGNRELKTATIPHGISTRFFHPPKIELEKKFNNENPYKLLYVSIISPYKHQWVVAEACAKLRAKNIPLHLDLIGPADTGIDLLQHKIEMLDPGGSFISYYGSVPYEKLEEYYNAADIGVFASSCENMPNILLEGMAAGLPMACSSMGPMPEILKDAGVYFNPLDANDVAQALLKLISSTNLRKKLASTGFKYAEQYSWERCANETFNFLADVANSQTR